eukprot:Colp12_sorted_trinity150504_noHs@28186
MRFPEFIEGALSFVTDAKCREVLFDDFDFFNKQCIMLVITRCINLGIVSGAGMVKLPQILKIVSAKSVLGLSLASFLLETIAYSITIGYNYGSGYAFRTWGENLFLGVQSALLVLLVLAYSNRLFTAFLFIPVFVALGGSIAYGLVPLHILSWLQKGTIAMFALSKIPQIFSNFKNGHTGQLSFVSTLMQFVGSALRIFTTLQEVNDITVLAGFLSGTTLNGILFLQILLFWKKTNSLFAKKSGTSAPAQRPAKSRKVD